MVKEVLLDREVEVEGRLLEDDPDKPKAIQGPFPDVHPKDADRSLGLSVEPRGERKQRRFSGAVQPEQHGKVAGRDRERDVLQRSPLSKAMPEILDTKCCCCAHESLTGERRYPKATDRPGSI